MNDPFAAIAQPGAAPNPSAWSASYDPAKDPNAAGLPQPVGPVRGDPFAAIAQATPPPALPVSVQLHDLSANPRGEGTYKMQGKDGTPLQVPYSNVQHAMKTGYDMAGAGERARFSEDYMADPSTTHGVIERLTSLPMDMNVGAAKALLRSVGNLAAMAFRDPSVGLPEGAIDAIEKSAPVRAASDFANQPNKNVGQTAGDVGENVAEYFAGDELLKMAGSFKGAETLQKMMTERPVLGKLLRIGLNTAKQATIGGGQTYVHTGGDVGATAESAGINAAVTAGLGAFGEGSRALIEGQMPEVRTVEGTRIPVPKGQAGPTPAQVAGAEAYGKAAGATVAPHLAAMGAPPEFIENTLNSVHDFTGAADRLRDVNRNAYEFLDQATSGRFRKLNAEISQAQQASWDGVEGADRLYTQKTREMEDLLGKVQSGKPDVTVNRPAAPGTDLMKQGSMARPGEPARTGGTQKVSPGMSAEDLAAIKTSWRQYYILRDAGRTLDGALDGVPGASAVSQEQRGINGGRLMSGLKKMVNRYGRATVEQSMGPGRLANLEAIANATRTNADRKGFNTGVRYIAHYLPGYLGAGFGWEAGGAAGATVGGLAGERVGAMTQRALNAIQTDPKIGESFLYALGGNARPEVYGPFYARMIVNSAHAAARALPAATETATQRAVGGGDDDKSDPALSSTDTMATRSPRGLVAPGNINIWNRPTVRNADGSHSSEYSVSFQDDAGHEVLVPTIVNGRFLTPDGKKPPRGGSAEKAMFARAWQHYQQTGQHLGKFDNPDDADAYAEILHNRGDRQ